MTSDRYAPLTVEGGCLMAGHVTVVDLEKVPGLTASQRGKIKDWLEQARAKIYDDGYVEGYAGTYDEGYAEGYDDGVRNG